MSRRPGVLFPFQYPVHSMADRTPSREMTARHAIAEILGPFRRRIAAFGGASFVTGLLEALFLVVVTRSALAVADGENSLTLVGDRRSSIAEASAVAAGLLVVRLAAGFVTVRLQTGLAFRVTTSLRSQLGAAFLRSSWSTQSSQPRGMLQHLVVQFPSTIASLVHQLAAALAGGLGLASLLLIALTIDPLATLIVLVALVVLASCLWPIRRAVRRRAATAVSRQVAFATNVSEVADLSLEIRSLGVTPEATDRLLALIDEEARAQRRVGLATYMVTPVYTTMAYAAVLAGVVALDAAGQGNLESMGAVLLIMLRSLSYGQQLQHGSSALGQIAPVAEKLIAYRDEFTHAAPADGALDPQSIEELRLDQVTFAYPDHDPVLRNVSLTLRRGDIVGVIGPSGAGKTTLVQIILGLQPPSSGRIDVDGHSIDTIRQAAWHRLVTYVPQETRLLDGTVADNVRFLRPHISDDAVAEALARANLHLEEHRFPLGIHTPTGPSGGQLSGGQRQRLAIARCLATDPSVVVLDEPTSALDTESEEIVTDTLSSLRGRTTVIVVTHRESTLSVCDRVLAVGHGSVVENR